MRLGIRMPREKGLTPLEERGREGVSPTVIIITGYGDIDLCRRAPKSGAFEFLTWPVDADLLFEIFSTAKEIYKGQSEARKKMAATGGKSGHPYHSGKGDAGTSGSELFQQGN